MGTETISIESEFHNSQELFQQLQGAIDEAYKTAIGLQPAGQESAFRMDPTIVVALIASGTSVLTAVIAGLFTVLATSGKKSAAQITIKLADGQEIVVPRDASPQQIESLLESRTVTQIQISEKID